MVRHSAMATTLWIARLMAQVTWMLLLLVVFQRHKAVQASFFSSDDASTSSSGPDIKKMLLIIIYVITAVIVVLIFLLVCILCCKSTCIGGLRSARLRQHSSPNKRFRSSTRANELNSSRDQRQAVVPARTRKLGPSLYFDDIKTVNSSEMNVEKHFKLIERFKDRSSYKKKMPDISESITSQLSSIEKSTTEEANTSTRKEMEQEKEKGKLKKKKIVPPESVRTISSVSSGPKQEDAAIDNELAEELRVVTKRSLPESSCIKVVEVSSSGSGRRRREKSSKSKTSKKKETH